MTARPRPSCARAAAAVALVLAAAAPARAAARPLEAFVVRYEGGPVAVLGNRLRFGEGGTTYTRSDVNQDNLELAQRISAEARFGARHGLVLSYLPLELVTDARLPGAVRFEGETFAAGTPVESTYRFDGYRATWLYRAVASGRLTWDVGGALQLRAAYVQLASRDGAQLARTSNVGPVPALSTRVRWRLGEAAFTQLEATGLYTFSGKGGLYDVALTLGAPVAREGAVSVFGGIRLYGGGADVRATYNFAHFAFALAGVEVDLAGLLREPPRR
jgi:hypothetical protein